MKDLREISAFCYPSPTRHPRSPRIRILCWPRSAYRIATLRLSQRAAKAELWQISLLLFMSVKTRLHQWMSWRDAHAFLLCYSYGSRCKFQRAANPDVCPEIAHAFSAERSCFQNVCSILYAENVSETVEIRRTGTCR